MNRPISRRKFLSYTAQAAAATAVGLSYRDALAETIRATGKSVVLVNLQGGFDGLSLVVPYQNGVYYARRPNLAIAQNDVIPLNGEVGLHPEFDSIQGSVINEGRLAVIQQVGFPSPTRSHTEAQRVWSLGRRNLALPDPRGWIGRVADQYFQSHFNVFGIGSPLVTDFKTNRPEASPTVIDSLYYIGYSWDWSSGKDGELREDTARMHAASQGAPLGARALLKNSIGKTHGVGEQLRQLFDNYNSSIDYPGTTIGRRLLDAARIIQGNVGAQIIYTIAEGWDTHASQKDLIRDNLNEVAEALDSFVRDLKSMGKWQDTVILLFSEFGRSCAENGGEGTEDGHGNNLLVLGGSVRGGVYGPTPTPFDLQQEYLGNAIDFRSVLKTLTAFHLGLDPAPIFAEAIPSGDGFLPIFW